MVAGKPNQSPHTSPCWLLRYLRFIRGRCGDSLLSDARFPFCLFSALFVVHELITGTVIRSQVTLINSDTNAEFRFLLITSHSSTSISGAKKCKETDLIYPFNVSSLSSVRATTHPKTSFDFICSDVDVKIDKV